MGTLPNTVFQALLGWIRTLSSEIWNMLSAPESASILRWIGARWKELLLLICAVGLILDLIIYLIRWQPYRVWISFLRRDRWDDFSARKTDAEYDSSAVSDSYSGMDEEYGERHFFPDENETPPASAPMPSDQNLPLIGAGFFSSGKDTEPVDRMNSRKEEPFRRRQSDMKDSSSTEEADATIAPLQEGGSEDLNLSFTVSQTVQEPLSYKNEPEGTTEVFDQALRSRKRRSVSRILADEQRDATPPEQLIDRYAAYRKPVYPRNWKGEQWRDEGDQ